MHEVGRRAAHRKTGCFVSLTVAMLLVAVVFVLFYTFFGLGEKVVVPGQPPGPVAIGSKLTEGRVQTIYRDPTDGEKLSYAEAVSTYKRNLKRLENRKKALDRTRETIATSKQWLKDNPSESQHLRWLGYVVVGLSLTWMYLRRHWAGLRQYNADMAERRNVQRRSTTRRKIRRRLRAKNAKAENAAVRALRAAEAARIAADNVYLTGDLQILSPETLIQILNQEQESGELKVDTGEEASSGKLFFRDGNVIDAQCLDQSGEEAAYVLLSNRAGAFNFYKRDVTQHEITISVSTMKLLFEASRLSDEVDNQQSDYSVDGLGLDSKFAAEGGGYVSEGASPQRDSVARFEADSIKEIIFDDAGEDAEELASGGIRTKMRFGGELHVRNGDEDDDD